MNITYEVQNKPHTQIKKKNIETYIRLFVMIAMTIITTKSQTVSYKHT